MPVRVEHAGEEEGLCEPGGPERTNGEQPINPEEDVNDHEETVFAGIIVGLLTLLSAAVGPSAPQADEKSPVGTWFVYICPGSSDPCSTASPIVNLTGLTKDGIAINAAFGSPVPSPGVGVWAKIGPNGFAVTFVELLSDPQGGLASRSRSGGL